jgi:hypothetical protein
MKEMIMKQLAFGKHKLSGLATRTGKRPEIAKKLIEALGMAQQRKGRGQKRN